MTAKKIRHYLQFNDFSLDDYEYVLERARILKRKFKNYETYHPLHDRTLAMIFEKNSTRTRLSFEAGIFQLGGHAVFMSTRDTQLGRGEPIEDAAQVISRMVDIIMIRTFGQDIIQRFAENSRVPVINGLTNEYHPCQVLADIFTFYEHRGPINIGNDREISVIEVARHVCALVPGLLVPGAFFTGLAAYPWVDRWIAAGRPGNFSISLR